MFVTAPFAENAAQVQEPAHLSTPEQRRHVRFSIYLAALICWNDEFGDKYEAPAVVTDVSGGGFGVELGWRLPVGRHIEVEILGSSIPCVVRHSGQGEAKLRLGLEILPTDETPTAAQSLLRLSVALSDKRHSRFSDEPTQESPTTPRTTQGFLGDLRQDERHRMVWNVLVYWRDSSGVLLNLPGVVRNISTRGLGIDLERRIGDGVLASVETSRGSLQCMVRHAQDCGAGWRVGFEVLAASDSRNHQRHLSNMEASLAGESPEG